MLYREHAPAPELRAYVACYWTLEAERTFGYRVLPDGCMDLLFDVAGAAAPGVVGVMTRPLLTEPSNRTALLGVRFLPGEAFAFTGLVARETRDLLVPLDAAWGRLADELASRILGARDTAARIAILDLELARRRTRPSDLRLRRAVLRLRAAEGALRVADLAAEVGLGERHLERLFDERVGVGPKALARVARVHAVLTRLAASQPLSRLSSDLGYADQSHLVRDLRHVAGMTPTELSRLLKMSGSSKPPHGPLATHHEP